MWTKMLKVAAATAAFGILHSALASRPAKRIASNILGERNRNGLYRVLFLAQSAASCAALVAYIRSLPSRELYRITGPPAVLLSLGQLAALGYAVAAVNQIGIDRISGLRSLASWRGGGSVQPEPEAQGPALDAEGIQRAAGPFAWSRHPLNLVPLPVLWLWPRMTTSLLAFNAAATVYLIVGSLHEESRLHDAYGDDYGQYQASGVSFFFPLPNRKASGPLYLLISPSGDGQNVGSSTAASRSSA